MVCSNIFCYVVNKQSNHRHIITNNLSSIKYCQMYFCWAPYSYSPIITTHEPNRTTEEGGKRAMTFGASGWAPCRCILTATFSQHLLIYSIEEWRWYRQKNRHKCLLTATLLYGCKWYSTIAYYNASRNKRGWRDNRSQEHTEHE